MIELKDVQLNYKDFNLDIASFTCKKGEIVSLIGPSGSGKSSLVSLVSGLIQSNRGTITVGGSLLMVSWMMYPSFYRIMPYCHGRVFMKILRLF